MNYDSFYEKLIDQIDMEINTASMSLPSNGIMKNMEYLEEKQESLETMVKERADIIRKCREHKRNKGL
jgi:hypothetical protein